MTRLVFYHHPQAENFSLKFSSTSVTELRSQQEQSDGSIKLIGYPFETPIYVLYGREPDIDWDDVYFQASPPECDHYLYDEDAIEDYCPKCGSTMDTPDTTLRDHTSWIPP